jgi:hypothetical protein
MTVTARLSDRIFVGSLSDANKLDVVERDGDLICRMRLGWAIVQQVFALFWGVLLAIMVWSSLTQRPPRPPWIAILFMSFLGALSWSWFFRNLLGTPHLVVSGATGDIEFFRFRTRQPSRTIRPSEISHFTIETQFYVYRQHQTENAVLILFTTAGERCALCGSPDKALIASLGEKLANRTQRKIETNVAT